MESCNVSVYAHTQHLGTLDSFLNMRIKLWIKNVKCINEQHK